MSETRDDLREALARAVHREADDGSVWALMPDEHRECWRQSADRIRAQFLAPILAQVSALQAEVERERHNKEQWRDLSYENAQAADRLSAEAKRLNALLAPFVAYAKAHQRSMWGSGEIGGVIGPDGLRCAIRDSDLMALLEAPSDNPLTETKEGSDA